MTKKLASQKLLLKKTIVVIFHRLMLDMFPENHQHALNIPFRSDMVVFLRVLTVLLLNVEFL